MNVSMCESVSSVCVSVANFIFISNLNYCTVVSCNAVPDVCVLVNIFNSLCLVLSLRLLAYLYMPCEWILIRRRKLLVSIFQPMYCLIRTHTSKPTRSPYISRAHLQPKRIIYQFCFNNLNSLSSLSLSRPRYWIHQFNQSTREKKRTELIVNMRFFLTFLCFSTLIFSIQMQVCAADVPQSAKFTTHKRIVSFLASVLYHNFSQFSESVRFRNIEHKTIPFLWQLSEPKQKTESVFFRSMSIRLSDWGTKLKKCRCFAKTQTNIWTRKSQPSDRRTNEILSGVCVRQRHEIRRYAIHLGTYRQNMGK